MSVEVSCLVSVIVPAFNAEEHLAASLASVHAQSYSHWELIVIDDGSKDRTSQVAAEATRNWEQVVKIVRTENQGLARARNNGVAEASGELICFLDSDDIWFTEKLAAQIKTLSVNPAAGATSCGFVRFLSSDPSAYSVGSFDWSAAAVRAWLLQAGGAPGLGSTLMIRRNVLDAVGPFDPALGSHAEDLDFGCRLKAGWPVIGDPQVLVGLRVWSGQVHGNLEAMGRSLALIQESHLTGAERDLRTARANTNVLLGTRYLMRGRPLKGLARMGGALCQSPLAAARYLSTLVDKARASRLNAHEEPFWAMERLSD